MLLKGFVSRIFKKTILQKVGHKVVLQKMIPGSISIFQCWRYHKAWLAPAPGACWPKADFTDLVALWTIDQK